MVDICHEVRADAHIAVPNAALIARQTTQLSTWCSEPPSRVVRRQTMHDSQSATRPLLPPPLPDEVVYKLPHLSRGMRDMSELP